MSDSILREAPTLRYGWRVVTLREVCLSTETTDPLARPEMEFNYVDISAVDNVRKTISLPKRMRGSEAPSRARNRIRSGDVIVATIRPNLNAVAKVPDELDGAVCSTGFCVLRAGSRIDADYLFFYVQSPDLVQSLTSLVAGSLYPAVTDRQVLEQLIPLPPLIEQRRIAALLREQFAEIERARAAAESQLKTISALPGAYLREAFTVNV